MIAMVGSNASKVQQLINLNKNNSGVCEIANDNAIGQIVVGGNKESVSLLQEILKKIELNAYLLK